MSGMIDDGMKASLVAMRKAAPDERMMTRLSGHYQNAGSLAPGLL